MQDDKGDRIATFFGVALLLLCLSGWVMNIVTIATTDPFVWTGIMVVRCIGIICFPAGIVMGWV